jgi:AcrR family transcriptional regulator
LSRYDPLEVTVTTPPSPTDRRLRADARRNRERILEAARAACAQYGPAVQMDDVAARAGVGVGTVYRHFATKDALMEALVAEKIRTFAQYAREAMEVEDPWEAFAGLLRRDAELMAADAGLRQAVIMTGAVVDVAQEERAELEALGAQLIARGQAAGVIRDDLGIEDIPMVMSGLCGSMSNPEFDWRRHLELVLDGLRARA